MTIYKKTMILFLIMIGLCGIFLFCINRNNDSKPVLGVRLSEKDRKVIKAPLDLLYGNTDADWDDWEDEDSPKKPEDADPDLYLKAIQTYEKLDGYKLESGRIFHKENTDNLILHSILVIDYDALGKCEESKKTFEKFTEIAESEKLILIPAFAFLAVSLIYPQDEGYEELKKDETERILIVTLKSLQHCTLFEGQEERVKEYYSN